MVRLFCSGDKDVLDKKEKDKKKGERNICKSYRNYRFVPFRYVNIPFFSVFHALSKTAESRTLVDCRLEGKVYDRPLNLSSINSSFSCNFRKRRPAALPHHAEMHS